MKFFKSNRFQVLFYLHSGFQDYGFHACKLFSQLEVWTFLSHSLSLYLFKKEVEIFSLARGARKTYSAKHKSILIKLFIYLSICIYVKFGECVYTPLLWCCTYFISVVSFVIHIWKLGRPRVLSAITLPEKVLHDILQSCKAYIGDWQLLENIMYLLHNSVLYIIYPLPQREN